MGRWSSIIRLLMVAMGIFFGQKIIVPIIDVINGAPIGEAMGWVVAITTGIVLYLFVEFCLFKVRREGFVA